MNRVEMMVRDRKRPMARPACPPPDLDVLQHECEANFSRLMQLAPGLRGLDRTRRSSPGCAGNLKLEVLEQSRYTTALRLSQAPAAGDAWSLALEMDIRVYYDARMAEVVKYQGESRFRIHYPYAYPNRRMVRRDEKQQLNLLLGEWLSMCLAQGHRFATHEALASG